MRPINQCPGGTKMHNICENWSLNGFHKNQGLIGFRRISTRLIGQKNEKGQIKGKIRKIQIFNRK